MSKYTSDKYKLTIEDHIALSKDEDIDICEYAGLARKCPKCGIVAHYNIKKNKKPQSVECPACDHGFTITKYKKGERPR